MPPTDSLITLLNLLAYLVDIYHLQLRQKISEQIFNKHLYYQSQELYKNTEITGLERRKITLVVENWSDTFETGVPEHIWYQSREQFRNKLANGLQCKKKTQTVRNMFKKFKNIYSKNYLGRVLKIIHK